MKHITPIRAIKLYCKNECCIGDMKSWKECTRKFCPLYSYRLGKRPNKSNEIAIDSETNKTTTEEDTEE